MRTLPDNRMARRTGRKARTGRVRARMIPPIAIRHGP